MESYSVKINDFEGPLDLLLQLIESEKMDITTVSLAKITDEFLAIVEAEENFDAADIADFLAVAAKLLLIKSRILLPSLNLGTEDEGESLAKQLKIYKEYRDASKMIKAMIAKERFLFVRPKAIRVLEVKFVAPIGFTKERASEMFANCLKRLEPIVNLPQRLIKRAISIKERISHISRLIFAKTNMTFRQLIGKPKDKVEIVVSFLALLELVKQKAVDVSQTELFADINISKNNEGAVDVENIVVDYQE
jgi:segregation and condensation protein A